MKIVFRVDASSRIGSGHVMRCLTLAERLRDQGAEVTFICRELAGNLNDLITARSFELCRLSAPSEHAVGLGWSRHAAWLEVDWQRDADETLQCLNAKQAEIDWLVVDHYALDQQWEVRVRPALGRIMVIDDLADRLHDCDLLLDQNLYTDQDERYIGLTPQACERLLGPSFALLRPEFTAARNTRSPRTGAAKRIHVFMGGSDPDNVAGKVLDALQSLGRPDLAIDLVVGAQTAHRQALQQRCQALPQVTWHENVADMANLMSKADLAVGAGGTTVWERACLGLPSLVLSIADNQTLLAETAGEQGCCLYLGRAAAVTAVEITQALATLFKASGLQRHFSAAGLQLVDGRGVERVVRRLAQPVIQVREAVAADCETVFLWRNAPEVRAHFFDPEPIRREDHQPWFARALTDPDRILLIGEADNRSVGVVRYDLNDQDALVSVYLVPGQLGRGFGAPLLRVADQWLQQSRPGIRTVNAEILPGNEASLRAFAAAGYAASYSVWRRSFES